MPRKDNSSCKEYPRQTVAAYHECELTPAEELRLEAHLAGCGICADHLNSLKLVSTSLEILLEKEPVSIPERFSDSVKAAAQSSVDEVRSAREKSRGLFVAALLFSLTAVVVAYDVSSSRPVISAFADRLVAFGGFIGHLFYTLSVGFSVILGGVCTKLFFGSFAAVAGLVAILLGSLYVFSKHMTRLNRS